MYSKVIVAGRLGVDPEMRYAPSGDAVTSFSLASGRKYTDKSGNVVDKTTWFRVSVWGKKAEVVNQYLKKGSPVIVEGELIADPATGGPKLFQRKDGNWGASFEIKAFEVVFLPRGDGEKQSEQTADSGDDL